jgi:hypothetical protein
MNGVGQLAGLFPGDILVVGGGMRAITDLEQLQGCEFSCVLSANAHGFKIPGLKPNFIVCKDHVHTETKKRMHPQMAEHGVPIITRHWWGDFRLTEWDLQGNSGLMAIAVAAILGARDIYPIGFDNYREGTYFHTPDAPNLSRRCSGNDFVIKAAKIGARIIGTRVRATSGPLQGVFEAYGPEFQHSECELLLKYKDRVGHQVRAITEFQMPFEKRAGIARGSEFWISEQEYRTPGIRDNVQLLDTQTCL